MFAALLAISPDDRCECCGTQRCELKTCSRCKFVKYCSPKCQKSDFQQHKQYCPLIAKDAAIAKREEPKLRIFKMKRGEEEEVPVNLFETEVGHFGSNIPATHEYTFYWSGMAVLQFKLADSLQYPSMKQWNKIRLDFQEYLRLCTNDDFDLRYSFPFVLINCDLDDKAYAFSRCFILHQDDCDNHHGTAEGDWVYPTEEGCRFRDIFEQVPEDERDMIDVVWLVALLLVKFRLIAAFDAKTKSGDYEISEEEATKMEDNRNRQVPKLLDAIDAGNANMLPSLINPAPLLGQRMPPMISKGGAAEAGMVLMNALGPFLRCGPVASNLLFERYGPNPVYDTNLDPMGLIRPEYFTGEL